MNRTAFITGVSGQTGSYLAEHLLSLGYRVIGMVRRSTSQSYWRIASALKNANFTLEEGDITDLSSLITLFTKYRPDEVYNLAAMSHVATSFAQPGTTWNVTGQGGLNVLEALRLTNLIGSTKLFQASSSEMFGKAYSNMWGEKIQNLSTPFLPQSPYSCAKLAVHNMVRVYNQSYGLYGVCGIIFNKESPRRGANFVTRKITKYFYDFKQGRTTEKLRLGNLRSYRDWGYAKEYCINTDVPILTTAGWKYNNEININDEIINFNPTTNSLSNDKILKIHNLSSSGHKYQIQGRGVFLTCTPDHRILFQKKSVTSKGGWSDWKFLTAKEMFENFNNISRTSKYHYRLPHFQGYDKQDYIKYSDEEIYLLGVLLAEGYLSSNKSQGTVVSVSQSHIVNERVHSKLENIFNKLSLQYRKNNKNCGVSEWCFDKISSKSLLNMFDLPNIHICPKWVYQLSCRQMNILFESLMDCDGCWGALSYTSKRYLLACDFQTIAHLAGYRTSSIRNVDNCYIVQVLAKRKKYNYIQNINEVYDNKDVWCVSTKNGTIITRENNNITITGNCVAIHLMLQRPYPKDYIICTGETHTVEEFLREVGDLHSLNPYEYILYDQSLERPSEVDYLRGDATETIEELYWTPQTKFKELVKIMVDEENGLQ